jgi:ATP-binding cassette subfamily B protein
VDDAQGPAAPTSPDPPPKSFGRLGRLVRRSTSLVWAASPRPFLALLISQVVNALTLAAQIFAIKAGLEVVLGLPTGATQLADLLPPLLVLAGLTLLNALAAAIQRGVGRLLAEAVSARMQRTVLQVATTVELRNFESPAFYDQLERVQSSALGRPLQVTQGVVSAIAGVIASVGLGLTVVALHPVLLPILVVGGIPIVLASRLESRLEYGFVVAQTSVIRLRQYLSLVQTGREEAKEIRAFELGPALRGRVDQLYTDYLRDLGRHLRRRSAINLLGGLGSAFFLALTVAVLVLLIVRGSVSVAGAGAALVALRLLAQQVQSVFGGIQGIFESGLFLDDYEQFLQMAARERAEEEADASERPAPPPFRRIDVDGVAFSYPGSTARALDGVDLTLGRGEIVALVGENGSGKTTLAKIVAGLYSPDAGAVTWDGVDAQTYGTRVRDQIAVIFQDFVRYAISARDNIGFGRIERLAGVDADAAVAHAARATGADEFLTDLPAGYATPLSRLFDGGRDLSGGQWQRVALARAFFRDAPLVILDEPSSALDPRAEYELFASLRGVLAGRTALFISHRFSTVRTADRIYVMAAGRVTEHGTHDELMAAGGTYAELFALQASAYLDARPTPEPPTPEPSTPELPTPDLPTPELPPSVEPEARPDVSRSWPPAPGPH